MTNDEKQVQALAQRILVKAAHKLGGISALAKHIGLAEGTVGDFIQGKIVPSAEIITKAVEPLLDEPEAFWRDDPKPRVHTLEADK